MEKKINYLNRTFDDYKQSLLDISKTYYPEIATNFDDASIGSWLIDMVAGVSDNLSYHIDRVYNEVNINTAQQRSSLMALARNNGLKIPGPKASRTLVEFSCELPLISSVVNSTSTTDAPNWAFAPIIKRGTKVSYGSEIFEVMSDVNFNEQFDENGVSNRLIIPKRKSNGLVDRYVIKKNVVVVAGESKIYKKVIRNSDITPFFEILISDKNVMNVESIIFKTGVDFKVEPTMNEFMVMDEYVAPNNSATNVEMFKYFEVDSLIEQNIWTTKTTNGAPIVYKCGQIIKDKLGNPTNEVVEVASIAAGEWRPIRQKYITEFTDNGYLKVIFGGGNTKNVISEPTTEEEFIKYQLTKAISNNSLGVLPNPNTTMYILYRVGGGETSNIAKGVLNKIDFLDIDILKPTSTEQQTIVSNIKNSIKVTNILPSVSGKDVPSENELRYMIKYNKGSQNRCVTVKDYQYRLMDMPPKYGTPFRVGVAEENNKIVIYLLGLDYTGCLTPILPNASVMNMENYLSEYRMVNDFVEMKSGRVINLSFEVDIFVDKTYNKSDVVLQVIECVKNYMSIKKHVMGEDIFMGDLEKEISKVDGLINLIDLRAFNEFGNGYSSTQSTQSRVIPSLCDFSQENGGELTDVDIVADQFQIDLRAADGILFNESDVMMEIKYPEKDIRVRVKIR